MKKVSVVTAVFNRANLIERTIISLLSQTYSNWEHIIVDDGSTDNTVNVIEEYSQTDDRIKLFHRGTLMKGSNTCRNIGIRESRGDYIIFLDSDDTLSSFCLQQRVSLMSINPNCDFMVFPGIYKQIESEDYCPDNYLISSYFYKNKGESIVSLFINLDVPWMPSSPIYLREKLLQNDIYFDEDIIKFQDIVFHIKVLCSQLKFDVVKSNIKPDHFWVAHKYSSIGKTNANIDILQSNIIVIKRIISILAMNGFDTLIDAKVFFRLLWLTFYIHSFCINEDEEKKKSCLYLSELKNFRLPYNCLNMVSRIPNVFLRKLFMKILLLYKKKNKYFLKTKMSKIYKF
ncbi:MAG: glycosyltransferase family 2 protein [Tannerellaceae bacterium]|nr:glycosyltransferase family 2 protein [Tannerellaceae bacterium]